MDQYDEIIRKSCISDVDSDTYAMLKLIAYRAHMGEHSNYYALFAGDGVESHNISTIRQFKERIVSLLLYPISYLNSRKQSGGAALISDSLLMSDRYRDAVVRLTDSRKVVSYLNYRALFDYIHSGREGIDVSRFRSRSVCVGPRICGCDFINLGIEIYDAFCETDSGSGVQISADTIDRFARAIIRQKELIARKLVRSHIRSFITVNQYNAPDLLTIMACRDRNIVTKELLHYSAVMFPTDFYDSKPRISFAEVEAAWNRADIAWLEKYGHCTNMLYDEQRFEVVGCPEIDRVKYDECRTKYSREQSVILFAPCLIDYDNTAGCSASHKDDNEPDPFVIWRRGIYDAVSDFAGRNRLKPLVRFHPGSVDKDTDRADHSYLRERGFEILGYDREDFYRPICTCRYAISMSSSSAYMSLQYGCRCICLDDREQHDFCGLGIERMKVEDLYTYSIGDESTEQFEPDYFDEDKLIIGK